MADSELYLRGEAWEMRFTSAEIANGSDPIPPASRPGTIASAIRDAFELFGYDGTILPFLDC